ncbi:hypothetical protein BKP43_30950 [Variovorax boronicumulans]|uniref:DUF4189 domain-containing protein n=1 Tax=Variovorax boronicumulans TaxID=436515 RepID=UPI000BB3BABA|nr:DUF4189 domain-containing protein [Variovorax boronicumulans]PBI89962.1 hypothetical protein BKP43_30950 [Variovorax boronicumulans]
MSISLRHLFLLGAAFVLSGQAFACSGPGQPGCPPPNAPGWPHNSRPPPRDTVPVMPGGTGRYSDPDEYLAPPPPDPTFSYKWGAYVIDKSKGAFGGVDNRATQADAENNAIAQCVGNGGTATGCRSMTLTWQEGCGVVVMGRNVLSMKANKLQSAAQAEAMAECSAHAKDCKVVTARCNALVVNR